MIVRCQNPACYKRGFDAVVPDDGLCCPYCGNAYAVHGVDLRQAQKVAEAQAQLLHSQRLYLGSGTFWLALATAVIGLISMAALNISPTSVQGGFMLLGALAFFCVGLHVLHCRAARKFPLA